MGDRVSFGAARAPVAHAEEGYVVHRVWGKSHCVERTRMGDRASLYVARSPVTHAAEGSGVPRRRRHEFAPIHDSHIVVARIFENALFAIEK